MNKNDIELGQRYAQELQDSSVGYYKDAGCVMARLTKTAKRQFELLEHISEYWNRDENERAMANAL